MNIIFIPYLPTAVRAYPMAKYFVKAGNKVHMIIWDMPYPITFENIIRNIANSWKYKQFRKDGIIIHKIRRAPFFIPIINKCWFKRQIRKIYNLYDIDIIISETFFNETEPPLDLPILYDMSDDHEAYPEIYGSYLYKLGYKILNVKKTIINQISNSVAVTCVSEELINYAHKFRDDNIYKITNGVEDWVLNEKYQAGQKNTIVYVTNFGRWSEVIPLIHSINIMKNEYPDIVLALIGDGPEIPKAKELTKVLKLSKNIKFLGKYTDRKKLFKEINKYNVCLNVSEKNKFRDSASPMKVFEYSALGKKIVSTNLNEVMRLNFPNILFYKKDNTGKSLISSIKEAFNTKIDEVKTRKMVKKYSWSYLIDDIVNILKI